MFIPLPLQPHLVTLCAWWDIHAIMVLCYHPWIISNYSTSSQFVWIIIFLLLLHAFALQHCVYHIASCFITLIVAYFFHYVHASPAHLYIPALLTHCFVSIICVMLS